MWLNLLFSYLSLQIFYLEIVTNFKIYHLFAFAFELFFSIVKFSGVKTHIFFKFQAFAHRLLLEKHMNHACAMEEWPCPICSKVFTCKEKLRFHLATHCDYKPYVCRYCPYRFVYISTYFSR